MSEDEKGTMAEQLNDIASDETEEKKALTRSIHIVTLGIEVTVTSQDPDDTLDKIKELAIELSELYKNKDSDTTRKGFG